MCVQHATMCMGRSEDNFQELRSNKLSGLAVCTFSCWAISPAHSFFTLSMSTYTYFFSVNMFEIGTTDMTELYLLMTPPPNLHIAPICWAHRPQYQSRWEKEVGGTKGFLQNLLRASSLGKGTSYPTLPKHSSVSYKFHLISTGLVAMNTKELDWLEAAMAKLLAVLAQMTNIQSMTLGFVKRMVWHGHYLIETWTLLREDSGSLPRLWEQLRRVTFPKTTYTMAVFHCVTQQRSSAAQTQI